MHKARSVDGFPDWIVYLRWGRHFAIVVSRAHGLATRQNFFNGCFFWPILLLASRRVWSLPLLDTAVDQSTLCFL